MFLLKSLDSILGGTHLPMILLRLSVALLFAMFGIGKLLHPHEAKTLAPFIGNSPFLKWMYWFLSPYAAAVAIGIVEILIAALLISGFFSSHAGVLGGFLACCALAVTLSFLATTPDVAAADPTGMAASTRAGFLLKDIPIFAASLVLFAQSLSTFVKG